MLKRVLVIVIAVSAIGAAVALLAPTPEAQRRAQRRADEPALTVEEYTPRSTLVVDEHPVPRAKFPAIDIHSHHWRVSDDQWAQTVGEMDELNLQVLVNLSGGSGRGLEQKIETIRESAAPQRMVHFVNLDFGRGAYAGFGQQAADQLERDVSAGAGRAEVFQELRHRRTK